MKLMHLKTKINYTVSQHDIFGNFVRARKFSDILKFERVLNTHGYTKETLNKKPLERLSDFKVIF